jgi:hypothetical protein
MPRQITGEFDIRVPACLWVKPDGEPTTRFGESFRAVLRKLGLDRDAHELCRILGDAVIRRRSVLAR